MSFSTLCHRTSKTLAFVGLAAALWLAEGCHRKAAAPAATPAAKPAPVVTTTNVVPAAPTNAPDDYTSKFDDLTPEQGGKDPFYPSSHRLDTVAPTVQSATPAINDLILQAIIHGKTNSQAVINNQYFEVGEKPEDVRVPNGKVTVRCLAIGTNSVRIQVEGQEPQTLTIQQTIPSPDHEIITPLNK